MTRMSTEKRIELGQKMVELWTAEGCESDRWVRFAQDMLVRLNRGKGLTPRQRDWFDSVVVSAPPKPQNETLVVRLRELANLVGMEDVKQVMTDFAYKLSRGWNLTERQLAFMYTLMDRGEEVRKNGPWQPDEEERAAMEMGVAFARRYAEYFLSGQPGLSKSIQRFHDWRAGLTPTMDKWSAGKLMALCKGDRAVMVDAGERWPKGGLVETKQGSIGLVLSAPHVDKNGRPALLVLLDGEPRSLILESLVKPRKKRKKAAA